MLIPIAIVVAGVIGYAAVALKSNHVQPTKEEPAPPKQMAAGEPSQDHRQYGDLPGEGKDAGKPEADDGKGKQRADGQKPAAGQKQPPKGTPGAGPSEFRKQHEQMFKLQHAFFTLAVLERTGASTLTAAQAKQILDIMTPLRSKPKLTEEEAKQALARVNKVLTAGQLKAIADAESGRGNRPRPGDGQRPPPPAPGPGQKPPEGARRPPQGESGQPREPRQFDPEAMKDFNPFYTGVPNGGAIGPGQGRRMDVFFDTLTKKAGIK